MKNYQQGVATAVWVLLGVLLIGGAAAGVVLYISAQNSETDDSAKRESVSSKDSESADEKEQPERTIADWTVLETAEYTVPVPDGWKLKQSVIDFKSENSQDHEFSSVTEETLKKQSNLEFKKGIPATIKSGEKKTMRASEPTPSLIRMTYSHNIGDVAENNKKNSDKTSEDTTKNGDTIFMAVRAYKKDTPSIMGLIKEGTHYYDFVIEKKSSQSAVTVTYIVEPGMTDYSGQLQKALMQLTFL